MDQENRMPLIGDKAPSFEAVTTQGPIKFPEDYAGKWVILFSHPADFTPVCTTEFMTFGSMIDEFKALNTELVGLSVDSIYSHIAWLRKIQELEWNGKKHINVTFPLIEDIRMEVAKQVRHDPARTVQYPGGTGGVCHRPQRRGENHPVLSAVHGPQL